MKTEAQGKGRENMTISLTFMLLRHPSMWVTSGVDTIFAILMNSREYQMVGIFVVGDELRWKKFITTDFYVCRVYVAFV